jgi:hypothetical protein
LQGWSKGWLTWLITKKSRGSIPLPATKKTKFI